MKKKNREVTVSTILFIVAIAILMVTYGRTGIPAHDLLSKVGFALLVAVVIRATLVYLYGEDNGAFDKFRDLGMNELHFPLTEQKIQELLGDAREIKVLKTWFPESPEIETGLELAIKKNSRVRLLLCKPGSVILEQRSLGAGEHASTGSSKVYRAVERVYGLASTTERTDVQIACYESWPGCPVIWYDKKILMGFYFRGKSSPKWPWISVGRGTDLATILDDQFKELWEHSRTTDPDTPTKVLDTPEKMRKWLEDNKKWQAK